MNSFSGIITQIQHSESILLVDVAVDGRSFSAMLIESTIRPEWLHEGGAVNLIFKETEVSIAKNFSGMISFRNKIESTITGITVGKILSTISLQSGSLRFNSAITSRAVVQLNLQVGDVVTALVKANEISIST